MAPTVHYADPDGRDNRDESGLANLQEAIMPEPGDMQDIQQQPESDLNKEISDHGTVFEIPMSNDGRRRSSRLRGKGTLGTAGLGDGSPPVGKQSSGSGKRGRRKKAPVLESVQVIGDSVEELKNEVIVESVPLELATQSADLGASPAGDDILARIVSVCEEPTLPHDNGNENAAKVVKLEGRDVLDGSPFDDREAIGIVRPLVDSRGDFCDSNIFENLQSIVILHPEENAIHNDVPSTSKIQTERKIEKQMDDVLEANLTKEEIRVERTGLVNVSIRSTAPEKSSDEEVMTLSVVQASSEITLQACKTLTGSETELVVSDLKEEGASRGSNSTSKVRGDGPKLNGEDGEDGSKLNGIDGEDSSSVTSRDGVEHTTATCEEKDCKATSGDKGGGVSKLASDSSLSDVHMASNSELLVEETIVVQSRKVIPINSKEPHEDDDQVGSRSSSEAKFSSVSPSKSSMLALSPQVLVNGNADRQNASSIVLERRATLQTTSEIACQRTGEGEDLLQLGRKSDSLKSVNQEISVRDGGVPSALKVESKAEVRRSHSRHAEDDSSGVTEGDVNTTSEKMDESVGINSKAGWVKCDDCRKWRSIPVDLAEKIGETNAYWSCKENPNKKFADCSIPQVKSNEEINRELGISESSFCDEDDDVDATCDSRPLYNGIQAVTENGQAVWTLIKRNIFKHRSQKHQDADEAMVCQCSPPRPGEVGCGEDCLNRMLNVECLPQQCPCGSLCTNQQFQKRCYGNVELFRCGKKGHGLRALENIPSGSFIIEYVGEVLDMASFEERQKDYSLNSQKHFYFMTLSASEIIDACSKGNLGRFINHSCEPNCQTEKWMVDGEVCIGLFAIRDLKEGEEITFDYNFVRVGGADAKKCECGASKCRGFIGVDPDTPQNVVDIDSDEGEDPEPIMLQAESDEDLDDKVKEGTAKKARMIPVSDSKYEKLGGVKRKFYSGLAKDLERPKRKRRVKTAASSRIGSHVPAPSKLFAGPRFGIRNSYHSDVEGKLGELTNESGGLKQRDAAKPYLKLLVLTAASGGTVNGAAACSARDLSMLLEALLKTQKLSLLKDIMNKNGLQMFHNLLKQFRKSFEKRPILRKLLKVLDHLAKNRVLTVEHIYSPPRSGTECFSDTLFDLSRHDDAEVQRMARDFRKQYVPPRPHKPVVNIDRSLVKSPLQQAPATHSSPLVSESPLVCSTASNSAEPAPTLQGGTVEEKSANPPTATRRKRPSRWDTVPDSATAAAVSAAFGLAYSAAAASLHGSVRHLPAVSGSQQVSVSAPDPSLRVSMSSAPSGIPGRPSGAFPPIHAGGVQHHQALPGHMAVGLPGHRQPVPQGRMHMGVQRVPNSNELPPASQRPYPGPHPMQVPLQMQPVAARPLPFLYSRTQSMHTVPPGQWPVMHPMGGPLMHPMAYPPPPPPLPPSVRPGWGHNGPRQSDAFPGHVKIGNIEPIESEAAGEPPVPGMSPANLRGSRKSENISSGVPEVAPGSARSGTRVEAPPRSHRDEHAARISGQDSIVVNRSRSMPDSRESAQQAYSHPEGTQGRKSHPEGTQGRNSHPEGTQGRNSHPEGIQGRNSHPEGTQGRNSHPGGTQGRNSHPEGIPGRNSHPEGTQGRNSHPGGTQGRNSHPEGTQGRNSHPEGTQGRNSHPEGIQGRNSHPEGIQGRNSHPEGTQGRNSHPEGIQGRNSHPDATQARNSHPEGTQGRNSHPEGTQGRISHPEGTQGRNSHPEGTQGRNSHPEGIPGRNSHPEGTQGRNSHPEGTQGRNSHPEGIPGRNSRPEGIQGRNSHPEGTQGRNSHPEGIQGRNSHPDATQARNSHPEGTQGRNSHPEGTQGRISHLEGKGQREMSWDTPECSSFHHHVSGMIRARVEMKHLVHHKDFEKFCSKLTDVVTRKEIKKYRENKIQGMTKTILRSKLLEKVDAYVDLQIGLYSKLKSGEGQS